MTKRDYILITQIIGAINILASDREIVAREFGRSLQATNDRFNYAKFMDACQKEIDKSVLPSGNW